MSERRAKRGRLSRSAEFDRVYRQGRSQANRHLVLYTFARSGEDGPRLGLSVSRKVGGAVERNRVKRLLREAFWAEVEAGDASGASPGVSGDEAAPAPPGATAGGPAAEERDFVIVARPEARELAERDGLEGLRASLRELLAEGDPPAAGDTP